MPIKNRSQAYYEKKAKRLQVKLDDAIETRHRVQREYQEFKAHSHEVLTSHLGKIRRQDETLASNNMTIQELNDQVAVQWQQRAEARSDVERAERFAKETAEKHNKLVFKWEDACRETEMARQITAEWVSESERIMFELHEARKTLQYRLWQEIRTWPSKVMAWRERRKDAIVNWWVVHRLNKPRVAAMSEAGYIPEKLIKLAHKYYEADKERMSESLVQYIGDNQYSTTYKNAWSRFLIWCGRA